MSGGSVSRTMDGIQLVRLTGKSLAPINNPKGVSRACVARFWAAVWSWSLFRLEPLAGCCFQYFDGSGDPGHIAIAKRCVDGARASFRARVALYLASLPDGAKCAERPL